MRCAQARAPELYLPETPAPNPFSLCSCVELHHTLHQPKELTMNRLFSAKPLVAAAIALGAVVAASAAHARSDVIVSIGLNVPVRHHVEPAPVYVQPQPVYVQPRPAFQGYRDYGHRDYGHRDYGHRDYGHRDYGDRHYAQRSGPHGDSDRDGVANRFDRDSRWFDPRAAYRHGGRRDVDHDGVPNRADRAPHNPYRY
jgi:hypothetical protein